MSDELEWFKLGPEEITKPGREPVARKKCAQCRADWSTYMDMYHGKDAWAAALCSECRIKYERSLILP